MKNQIKLFLVLIICITSFNANAQWQYPGSDTYFNTGKVGIGAGPSSSLLTLKNSGASTAIEYQNAGTSRTWRLKMETDGIFRLWGSTAGNVLSILPVSGNVGIGTTSPDELLHIEGPSGSVIRIADTAANTYLELSSGNAGSARAHINTGIGGSSIDFKTAGIDRMSLTTTGLGIGTTSPTAKFHINNTAFFTASSLGDVDSPANPFRIHGRNGSSTSLAIVTLSNTSYGLQIANDAGTGSGNFSLNPFGGNVGIGTTIPNAKLDIVGSATGDSYLNSPTLKVSAGSTSGRVAMWLETESDNATDFVFRNNGIGRVWFSSRASNENHDFRIYTNPDETGGPEILAMSISQNGNVGIGTSNLATGYNLSVKGKIMAEEIKVQAYPWPDYVFSKNYNLKSLEATESYIKEEGHLPNIPSAMEVEENGILLGEMNAKLLEKIEELTLHLIDQNKRNETQSQQLANQSQQIQQLRKEVDKLKIN